MARGRLAAQIVEERLRLTGVPVLELRSDLIGVDALHGPASRGPEPYEVRLRVAARTASAADAWRVAREVESLYTNGPAGGGGASTAVAPGAGDAFDAASRGIGYSWRVEVV